MTPVLLQLFSLFFDLVVASPSDPCLFVMNSRSPSLEVSYLILQLSIYSSISTIIISLSPLIFQKVMTSARS